MPQSFKHQHLGPDTCFLFVTSFLLTLEVWVSFSDSDFSIIFFLCLWYWLECGGMSGKYVILKIPRPSGPLISSTCGELCMVRSPQPLSGVASIPFGDWFQKLLMDRTWWTEWYFIYIDLHLFYIAFLSSSSSSSLLSSSSSCSSFSCYFSSSYSSASFSSSSSSYLSSSSYITSSSLYFSSSFSSLLFKHQLSPWYNFKNCGRTESWKEGRKYRIALYIYR